MGSLHQGHLALTRRARRENATVAVSVFVNPTQFDRGADYGAYPRNFDLDLSKLDEEGVDLVFAPPEDEMFPPGFNTWVEVSGLSQGLEGERRPGHFKGVATVVAKLLNVAGPDRAYFGQKDGQQLAVVRALVRDLNLPVEIVSIPTVRESDGLAMSSRNALLSGPERRAAAVIHRSLVAAKGLWDAGERGGEPLRAESRRVLAGDPGVSRVDYVSVADPDTLCELDVVNDGAMVSTAVWIGETRLIDNLLLGPGP